MCQASSCWRKPTELILPAGQRNGWITAEDVLWSRDSTALSSAMAAPVLAARSSSSGCCRSSALSQWYVWVQWDARVHWDVWMQWDVSMQGSALGHEVCSAEIDLGEGGRGACSCQAIPVQLKAAHCHLVGLQDTPNLGDTQQFSKKGESIHNSQVMSSSPPMCQPAGLAPSVLDLSCPP